MNVNRSRALAAFALAGVGLAACSTFESHPSSATGASSSYSGAMQPQPLQNGPSAASGQSSASPVSPVQPPYGYASQEQAERYESAFRRLDTNGDGVIDRQEFSKLQLVR